MRAYRRDRLHQHARTDHHRGPDLLDVTLSGDDAERITESDSAADRGANRRTHLDAQLDSHRDSSADELASNPDSQPVADIDAGARAQ